MRLQDNPFYTLGLSCQANRHEIVEAAENMSFLTDQEKCLRAQDELINPNKRLNAEIGWFIDFDSEKIHVIQPLIKKDKEILFYVLFPQVEICPLSRLNAHLYNFSKHNFDLTDDDPCLDEEYEEDQTDEVQYSPKDTVLDNWTVLAYARENMDKGEYTDAQRDALNIFGNRFDHLNDIRTKRSELDIKKQNASDRFDDAEVETLQALIEEYDRLITIAREEILKIEQSRALQDVLSETRKIIDEEEDKHFKERIQKIRAREENAATIAKYRSYVDVAVKKHISTIAQYDKQHRNQLSSIWAPDLRAMCVAILRIADEYSELDTDAIEIIINKNRGLAKFPAVQDSDIAEGIDKKRTDIRQILHKIIKEIEQSDYIEIITLLSELYSSPSLVNGTYYNNIVLEDLIDQYEILMQSQIKDGVGEIKSHIERIKQLANNEALEENIRALIRRVKRWNALVQPVQNKSYTTGLPHNLSRDVGFQLRELALWLYNEKSRTSDALMLVKTMEVTFSKVDEIGNLFKRDVAELTDIQNNEIESKAILAELDEIKKDSEAIKSGYSTVVIDSYVERLVKLDTRIKNFEFEDELKTQVRQSLCLMARDAAIDLHNNQGKTANALRIAQALLLEFCDIQAVTTMLKNDVAALEKQCVAVPTYSNYAPKPNAKAVTGASNTSTGSDRRAKRATIIFVVALIVLVIVAMVVANTDNVLGSASSKVHVVSEESESETKHSTSLTPGRKVYVDIVSIFPEIAIYNEGSTTVSYFVCRCEKSSGSTVWIYMTASEYREYFDDSASINVKDNYADEVNFPAGKRVHGKIKKADSIKWGLSDDTGELIIDLASVDG